MALCFEYVKVKKFDQARHRAIYVLTTSILFASPLILPPTGEAGRTVRCMANIYLGLGLKTYFPGVLDYKTPYRAQSRPYGGPSYGQIL